MFFLLICICLSLTENEAIQHTSVTPASSQPVPTSEWPEEIEGRRRHETPHALIYASAAKEAERLDLWLRKASVQFENASGYTLPNGLTFTIEPDQTPLWAFHRHFRIIRPYADPKSYYVREGEDRLDLAGAFSIPIDDTLFNGLSDLSRGRALWICFFQTDSFVRAWVNEAYEAVFVTSHFRSDAPDAFYLFASTLSIRNEMIEHILKMVDVRRRMTLFEAALDRLPLDSNKKTELWREHFHLPLTKELKALEAKRPSARPEAERPGLLRRLLGSFEKDDAIGITYSHQHGVMFSATFHPTKPYIMVVGRSELTDSLGVIRMYHTDSGRLIESVPKRGKGFSFSDQRTDRRMHYVNPPESYTAAASCQDGSTIAAATYRGTIDLYRLDRKARLIPRNRLDRGLLGPLLRLFDRSLCDNHVYSLFFRSSCGRLVSVSPAELRFWNVESRDSFGRQNVYRSPIAVSPNARAVVAEDHEGALAVWNTRDKAEIQTLEDHGHLDAVAFSPNGSRIACAFRTPARSESGKPGSGDVVVYDRRTGKALMNLIGHTDRVLSISFSEDNRKLLTGSFDRTVRFWDLDSGESRVLGPFEWETRVIASETANRFIILVGYHRIECWKSSNDETATRLWEDEWLANP